MAKQTFSYNDSITELETILAQIESEELDIDSLSAKVKRAAELIKNCKLQLTQIDSELQKVMDEIGE
jgi:exodeoxyribonuclease VII small subunit